jgi:hypothetical protein
VQFTAGAELCEKLDRLKALMRREVPNGDLAAIIELAVTEKLDRLQTRRFAMTRTPPTVLPKTSSAPKSRYVPAAVRRVVHERDGNRCRYVSEQGRRCSERNRLEYHHRHPLGTGGEHSASNIRLMCHAHNAYIAEHDYGQGIASYRGSQHREESPSPG